MKKLIISINLWSSFAFCSTSYETTARESWLQRFSTHIYCGDRDLTIKCIENNLAVLCESYPTSMAGDADCYRLIEILSFLPAVRSDTGKLEIIGRYQPDW